MVPKTIHTVSEVTAHIKVLFSGDELLEDLWLSGEVSNFKQHTSGHCYFTLKDAQSSIRAVIWRTNAARLALPREGDAVIAHGYVSVYEPQGQYQLYVDHLEPAGAGRLWLEFERLKAKLEAEGLFEESVKRPIPALPARIGVVTSPTAAALRDILRTIASRNTAVEVILSPSLVQGDAAPLAIVTAIEALNRWDASEGPIDAIIVARGGGSIEELWPFNDERVARAIRASRVPVITGIGHETDYTIADWVADRRAATPTAAAAAAVPDARELGRAVAGLLGSAGTYLSGRLQAARLNTESLDGRLRRQTPLTRLAGHRQRLDELGRRASLALRNRLDKERTRLDGQAKRLAALDPAGVLERGYAIVTAIDGSLVASKTHVRTGDKVQVRVKDGAFGATVSQE